MEVEEHVATLKRRPREVLAGGFLGDRGEASVGDKPVPDTSVSPQYKPQDDLSSVR